jgi:hypothetical protein
MRKKTTEGSEEDDSLFGIEGEMTNIKREIYNKIDEVIEESLNPPINDPVSERYYNETQHAKRNLKQIKKSIEHKEILEREADSVLDLNNNRIKLETGMKERHSEIGIHQDLLKAQLRAWNEELQTVSSELKERMSKVERMSKGVRMSKVESKRVSKGVRCKSASMELLMKKMEDVIMDGIKNGVYLTCLLYGIEYEECMSKVMRELNGLEGECEKEKSVSVSVSSRVKTPFREENVRWDGCLGLKYDGGLFRQCEGVKEDKYCKVCLEEIKKEGSLICGTVEDRISMGVNFKDKKTFKQL